MPTTNLVQTKDKIVSAAYMRTRSKRIFIVAQGTQDNLISNNGPASPYKSVQKLYLKIS